MGDVDGSFKKASARVVAIASAVSTARVGTSGSREADKSCKSQEEFHDDVIQKQKSDLKAF